MKSKQFIWKTERRGKKNRKEPLKEKKMNKKKGGGKGVCLSAD